MAKFIIWIVENSEELTKAWLKYAVDKVFQNDGYQSYWAETAPRLTKDKCIIVC